MGLFAKKTTVGIDLGHHTIKAMQLEGTADAWKVPKLTVVPTPPEAMKDVVIVDPSLMGLVLKQMLRDHHISATAASVAAAGGSVIVRPGRVPKKAGGGFRQ